MELSILTVTRRIGWEGIAINSLADQTYSQGEWIVVSENPLGRGVPYIKAPPKKRKSNLNASLNEGLRHCTGEFVIFYQDFIALEEDCFEKLMALVDKKTFVTTLTVNPDGKLDARYTGADCPRPCTPGEWEANVAIAPMKAIKELGGFDEEYDNGWSWDNVNLAERAAMLGYEFILDETNNPKLYTHDKSEVKELNGEFHAQKMRSIKEGKSPLKLNYL